MKFKSINNKFSSRLQLSADLDMYIEKVLQTLENANQLLVYRANLYSNVYISRAQLEIDSKLPDSIDKTNTLINKFLNNNKPARSAESLENVKSAMQELETQILHESIKQSIAESANSDKISYLDDVTKAIEAAMNRLSGIKGKLLSAAETHSLSQEDIANNGLDDLRQVDKELEDSISHLEKSNHRYDYIQVRMAEPVVSHAPSIAAATPIHHDASMLMNTSPYVFAAGVMIGALVVIPALRVLSNVASKTCSVASHLFKANTLFSGTANRKQEMIVEFDTDVLKNVVVQSFK